ncbi:MbtH family NRPS accessory protein [Streptomyces sp. SID685]|uniref:MbtH family protein n=1 Tax=Streptomyces sp. SID685 TaxID=2690322 RepID=UPI00136EDAE3|nr:MbtH family NRPS accessory protein [Streptomyces sp. SID685]MYR87844.1 MbtH family NRPS accessory protein [Streptomyces sp. SID685]
MVVRNHEDQYSNWRAGREVPAGWATVGKPVARAACPDLIEQLWTDMRPASLRALMDWTGGNARVNNSPIRL